MIKLIKARILYWLLMFMVGFVFVALVFGIVLFVYPYKIISFEDEIFPVTTPIVKAGGQVQYEVSSIKYMNIHGTVTRHLIDTYVYSYPSIETKASVCKTSRIVTLDIPTYAEPGIYHVKTVYTYRVNFLKTITYTKDTEVFEVIK